MTTDKLSSREQPRRAATDMQALAEAFCAWPLPQSVCSDRCATDPSYAYPRTGTNLLTVAEAKAMFDHLVDCGLLPSRVSEPSVSGWAVASIHDDRILVSTVSEHRRAAIVNFLVAYCGVLVTRDWSDEQISRRFESMRGGTVRLVEVTISEFIRSAPTAALQRASA